MKNDTPIAMPLLAGAMLLAVTGNYAVLIILAIGLTEVAWNACKRHDDISRREP